MAEFEWGRDSRPVEDDDFEWGRDSTPVEDATPAKAKPPGGAESFLRGAEQGATLGFADELGGGLQGGMQWLANKMPEGSLRWAGIENYKGGETAPSETYRAARDENRERYQAAADASPTAYGAGGLAGGVLSSVLVPGAAGVRTAAGAAKAGALYGAGAGLGGSEADLLEGDVGGALLDTGLSAGIGAGAGAGVALARPVASWASRAIRPRVEDFAARRAIKATGAIQSDIKGESERRLLDIGRQLLDTGVVTRGVSKQDLARRATDIKKGAGAVIGDVLEKADASGTRFDWGAVLSKMDAAMKDLGQAGREALKGDIRRFVYGASRVAQKNGGFVEANKLKSVLQDSTNFKADPKLKTNFLKRLGGILNEEIESQMSGKLGGQLASEFQAAKRLYGAMKVAGKGAKRGLERELGHRFLSPTDQIASGIGGVGGAVYGLSRGDDAGGIATKAAAGAAAGFGHKWLRQKGSSYAAATAKSASNALRDVVRTRASSLGKYGTALARALQAGDDKFAVTDYVLSQRDPEYREAKQRALAEGK
jgi:hypothetical protein